MLWGGFFDNSLKKKSYPGVLLYMDKVHSLCHNIISAILMHRIIPLSVLGYAKELTFRKADGSYSTWTHTPSSTWWKKPSKFSVIHQFLHSILGYLFWLLVFCMVKVDRIRGQGSCPGVLHHWHRTKRHLRRPQVADSKWTGDGWYIHRKHASGSYTDGCKLILDLFFLLKLLISTRKLKPSISVHFWCKEYISAVPHCAIPG